MNNYESERRGSRNRTLERSLSYSEAIGNGSGRSSIEIPKIVHTDVYTNEEIKKQCRISQTYVEGKEIVFANMKPDINIALEQNNDLDYTSEDEQTDDGLVMTIDVDKETPKKSENRNMSDASTRPLVGSVLSSDLYDTIETAESTFINTDGVMSTSSHYSTPYTKRRRRGINSRRQHGRPIPSRRVVKKSGEENVPVRSNIPNKSLKYIRDIVNTVINSKWRFLIMLMVCAHFFFWLVFAAIWYLVASAYREDIGDGKDHCITGTSSFAGLLMMSVETQMTIGYGVRYPNEECPEAILVMVLEIVAGTALSGGLSSLLFTKLVRPNKHVASVGFSRKATVCLRDGELCLQFRLWDRLNLHMIGSHITAYMLKPIRTLEGEMMQNYIHPLKLKEARVFLLWPVTVAHIIDQDSPLYDLSAQDMMDYRFEIVVCLTGSSKSMGTVTQSRTSYLSKEINWGYRFKNVIGYSKKEEAYVIDTDNLETIEQVDTPLCSASRLKEFEDDIKFSETLLSTPTNMSLSASVSQDDSRIGESLPSSPSFVRYGTQRSYGWSFRKFNQGNDIDHRMVDGDGLTKRLANVKE